MISSPPWVDDLIFSLELNEAWNEFSMTINPKNNVQASSSQTTTSSQQVELQGTTENVEQRARTKEIVEKSSIHGQRDIEVILAFPTQKLLSIYRRFLL